VTGPDGSVSYAELAAAIDDEVHRLGADGVTDGDRVAAPMANRVADVIRLVAFERLRTAVLVLDPASTGDELDQALSVFRPDVLVEEVTSRVRPPRARMRRGFLGLVTSGTSGLPRPVARPWGAVVANAAAFATAAAFGPRDRILCTTPLHHSYALNAGVVSGLLAGTAVELLAAPATPAGFWRSMVAGATVTLSVPFLYRWFTLEPRTRPRAARLAIAAGEPLDAATAERCRRAGLALAPHYGSTECGMVTLGEPGDDNTVGRPIPGVAIRTLGGDGAGEGELMVRPTPPAPWYVGDPGTTSERLWHGWFRTGDIGSVAADGRVRLHGRLGAIAKVAGCRVDLTEVEAAVAAAPLVTECVVVAMPAAGGGEEIHAFVVCDGRLEVPALRRYLAARLSAYKIPRMFSQIPAVPRTASGKIRRGGAVFSDRAPVAPREIPADRQGPRA
jgi:acyl-coenzyme A synthetase/AMP-(fatty) acid ligase